MHVHVSKDTNEMLDSAAAKTHLAKATIVKLAVEDWMNQRGIEMPKDAVGQ